jgi:hypothetical protein
VGNCISGQSGWASHVRIHATLDPDPPAAAAPQPNPAEAGIGPPALAGMGPQPPTLDSLPHGPRVAIAAFLQGPRSNSEQAQDVRGMCRDVWHLAQTSTKFRDDIKTVPPGSDEFLQFRLLNSLGQAVSKCLSELGAGGLQAGPYVMVCAPMLGLLTPAARADFVQQAIGAANSNYRGRAIAALAAGIVDLQPADRRALVEAAIAIGVGHNDDDGMGPALAALLEKGDCLQPEQREALIAAACHLIEAEGGDIKRAIGAFGKSICHLPAQQREALVQRALDVPDEDGRARALGGLGLAMAAEPSLNAGGRIVEAALLLGNEQSRAHAIAHLAVGMGSMEPELRGRFLTAARGFTDEVFKTNVASKLGVAAEHLSDIERAALVRFATVPGAIALSGPNADQSPAAFMFDRLCGLAAGMAHLSPEQCDDLSGAALGLPDSFLKAGAIGQLGQGLAHVSIDRREELVAAAIAIGAEQPGWMFAAIRGLGAGVKHLSDGQHKRLLGAMDVTTGDAAPPFVRLSVLAALASAAATMHADS